MGEQIIYGLEQPLYQYRELEENGEIRLLQVAKDAKTQKWCYSIEHFPLAEAPPYNTLSYVWGEDNREHRFELIDGGHLLINEALAQAFPFLASACTTGYLWVDQLCIDQAHIRERNHQVRQMGQIYAQCERVLIWLGAELHGNKGVRKLVHSAEKAARNFGRQKMPFHTDEDLLQLFGIYASLAEDDQKQALQLLHAPWFRRTWVLQELALPPDVLVLIGDMQVSFMAVCSVLVVLSARRYPENLSYTIREHSGRLLEHIRQMISLRNKDCAGAAQQRSFASNLCYIATRTRCSDPRDLVYGILGICDDDDLKIVPDYNADVRSVFTKATRAVLHLQKDLSVFQLFRGSWSDEVNSGEIAYTLPSWVPCYSDAHPLLSEGECSIPLRSPVMIQYALHSGGKDEVLQSRGKLIDTVIAWRDFSWDEDALPEHRKLSWLALQSMEECHSVLEDSGILHWLREVFSEKLSNSLPMPKEAEIMSACLRCVGHRWSSKDTCLEACQKFYAQRESIHEEIAEAVSRREPPVGTTSRSWRKGSALEVNINIRPNQHLIASGSPGDFITLKSEHSVETGWNIYPEQGYSRSMIVTRRGHVGFALKPRNGDEIAVVHGEKDPILLRPAANHDQHFELVQKATVFIGTGEYDDFWEENDGDYIHII